MPVLMPKPLTNHRFLASTPKPVLEEVQNRYKKYLVTKEDPLEDYFETEFHKKTSASMTPADWISIGRETLGWSQARLAAEVRGVSAKRISDWENGRRAVSKDLAKRLAAIFKVPADKFI